MTKEITVHCIAQTRVNHCQMQDWLNDIGASSFADDLPIPESDRYGWTDGKTDMRPGQEHVTDADLLVGVSGKRCYNSFEVGLNPNVTKIRTGWAEYIDNILASGHGCYDSETEVLTINGFKKWEDVSESDRLCTRRSDGVIEYHHPVRLINYVHSGRMYRVDGEQIDLLVTPDHKMLACPTTTRAMRKNKVFSLIRADELGHSSHCYSKTASYEAIGDTVCSTAQAELIGFAIGDGNIQGPSVRFRLRRERGRLRTY